MPATTFPYIPQARPAAIDDRLLAQLAKVGEDARIGMTTEAEAEWLLSTCGPLLRELLARRQVMAATARTDCVITYLQGAR